MKNIILLFAFISTSVNALSITTLSPGHYHKKFSSIGLANTKGLYHKPTDSIVIKDTRDKQDKAYTITHEVCHHIQHQKTSPILWTKYLSYYREDRVSPTRYGLSNVHENFAEICAHEIMNMGQKESRQRDIIKRVLKKPSVRSVIDKHL